MKPIFLFILLFLCIVFIELLSLKPLLGCYFKFEIILSDNLDSLKCKRGGGVIILRGSIFFVRVCANDTYSTVKK